VFDMTRLRDHWYVGIGVGIATGIKLTPGLFLVYLLLTRRFRAFAVASATFLATVLVGFVVAPHDSSVFWSGTFLDSGRIAAFTTLECRCNQSLYGLVIRLVPGGEMLWLATAATVLVAGLAVAVRAYRVGEEMVAVALVGLLTLLVSPVSWTHHWVWIVVVLLVVLDVLRRLLPRLTPAGQVLLAGLPAAVLLVFLDWPTRDPRGHLRPRGLVWQVPADGWWPAGEAYVLAALALLGAAAWWLRPITRGWREHPPVETGPTTRTGRRG
jgi:alpha-1,2-mannosyltransferase